MFSFTKSRSRLRIKNSRSRPKKQDGSETLLAPPPTGFAFPLKDSPGIKGKGSYFSYPYWIIVGMFCKFYQKLTLNASWNKS